MYQKNRLSEIVDENEVLACEIEQLKKQLVEIRKNAGCDVMDNPRVITNPVKETKLSSTGTYFAFLINPYILFILAKKPQAPETKSEDVAKPQTSKKEVMPKKEKPAKEKGGGNKEAVVDEEIDVGRLDLRVGRIVEAKKHPDADALYVETIDLGEDKPRTVVSGLVRHVPLEEVRFSGQQVENNQ